MRLAGSLTDVAVETQRRKHLAYLIADQGQLLGTGATTNLSQVGPRGRRPCLAPSVGVLEEAQSERGCREPTSPPLLCSPLPSPAPRAWPSQTTAVERPAALGLLCISALTCRLGVGQAQL